MSRQLIFWVLMLIWLVFGLVSFAGYGNTLGGHYFVGAGALLQFVLFLLLGWQTYGPPVHE